MSAAYARRASAPSRLARHIGALLGVACCLHCAEPTEHLRPPPAVAELEGPRGQVASAGPWLIKAFLPRDPAEVSVQLERHEEGEMWAALPSPPLTQSLQSSLWLGTLPILSDGERLRYRLSGLEQERLWREVSYLSTSDIERVAAPCTVTLIDPRPEQRLSARDDVGQASGLQYTFVAQLSSPELTAQGEALSAAVKLSVQLDSADARRYMSVVEGARAAFPSVHLSPGRQRARLEGFTSTGSYCAQELTFAVD